MVGQPQATVIKSAQIRNEHRKVQSLYEYMYARTGDQAVDTMGNNPHTSQVETLVIKSPTVDYTTAVVMRHWAVIDNKMKRYWVNGWLIKYLKSTLT